MALPRGGSGKTSAGGGIRANQGRGENYCVLELVTFFSVTGAEGGGAVPRARSERPGAAGTWLRRSPPPGGGEAGASPPAAG